MPRENLKLKDLSIYTFNIARNEACDRLISITIFPRGTSAHMCGATGVINDSRDRRPFGTCRNHGLRKSPIFFSQRTPTGFQRQCGPCENYFWSRIAARRRNSFEKTAAVVNQICLLCIQLYAALHLWLTRCSLRLEVSLQCRSETFANQGRLPLFLDCANLHLSVHCAPIGSSAKQVEAHE